MRFILLQISTVSDRRSAFAQFIEDCASWIGFDVWDWFAFLVASISLYVAYVTLKSQRRTEKNTQALLTLDGQLMLFSDLFLKLYTIQMNLVSKYVRKVRADIMDFELQLYKERGEDNMLSDPSMNFMYASNVPSDVEEHISSLSEYFHSYQELVSYPSEFALPLQNIHPELFYSNEFQFLLVNRLYTHIDAFNHKYEYLIQQNGRPNLRVLISDISSLAYEIRSLVKEIYLLNDKVRKLYTGIISDQIHVLEAGKYTDEGNSLKETDYYFIIDENLHKAFSIEDKTMWSNILNIILETSSPLRDISVDAEDIDFEIKNLDHAEIMLARGINLYEKQDYSSSFKCATMLTKFFMGGKAHKEDDNSRFEDLQSRVYSFVYGFGNCPEEVIWEDSHFLYEQWEPFRHRDDGKKQQ